MNLIKKFEHFIKEGAESTAIVGSGSAVGGGASGSFTSSSGQAVYGGDSGTAFATNSSAGMGAIHAAQPSSIPGDVANSKPGSGDIAKNHLGPFQKTPAKYGNKKKKNKNKRDRKYNKTGENIDRFYVTNYKESTSNGNIIQNWDVFTEAKLNEIIKKGI
jgi:hypothetical protein